MACIDSLSVTGHWQMRAYLKIWWYHVRCCQRASQIFLISANRMNALEFSDDCKMIQNLVFENVKMKNNRLCAIFFLLTCWRHHAQVCQCPGSKRVNFRSAPFASFFRTELEISESACSYTQIYLVYVLNRKGLQTGRAQKWYEEKRKIIVDFDRLVYSFNNLV